ncbi:MAG: serine/threonine protein phosphatase [Bacteroidia bacterium]|nr:serine/threonine protein phosphatase [Bacteroidia bacterium]
MVKSITGNTYIIGDIHGCLKEFRCMIEDRIRLTCDDELYLLGDYIDRGPDSKGVVDFIFSLKKNRFKIFPLRGNHEEMLLESLTDEKKFDHWLTQGADATLQSFGVTSPDQIPDEYIHFFESLPYYYELKTKKLILAHAGINFLTKDPFADTDAMVWLRGMFVDKEFLGDRKIIHGHTPVPAEIIREMIEDRNNPVICLDGGCVYKNKKGLGILVALNYEKKEMLKVESL